MNFIFTCPETGKVFETDAFEILENRGIKEDGSGNKYLDAVIEVTINCLFCEKNYTFDARELSCPFTKGFES